MIFREAHATAGLHYCKRCPPFPTLGGGGRRFPANLMAALLSSPLFIMGMGHIAAPCQMPPRAFAPPGMPLVHTCLLFIGPYVRKGAFCLVFYVFQHCKMRIKILFLLQIKTTKCHLTRRALCKSDYIP